MTRTASFILFISLLLTIRSVTALETGLQQLQHINPDIQSIDTVTLKNLLRQHPETVVIDVRTAQEILLLGGMIDTPRITNIPLGWLEFRVADQAPAADTPIVVYCGINQRSPMAAHRLQLMGYTNVKNYADGFFTWRDQKLPVEAPDEALDSFLFSKPIEVAKGVWSAIGATEPQSYANSGHNNNLSFIVTDAGVVVINAGNNYLLARSLHQEIMKISDQPVRYVILENGQSHANLGSAYWKEQGATIIAHEDAYAEIKQHGHEQLDRVRRLQRDKAMGTQVVLPDETFSQKKILDLGGTRIEILHLGPAHSPGDISVWLPQQELVITGDIAFHQRLLAVFENTASADWVQTWEKLEALQAKIVIPGHGSPTDMAQVRRYTRDYLVFLREKVENLLDEGETMEATSMIDQSAYSHLDTFEQLARRNASTVYRQMEFE